jgi:hypothetical protein
VSDIPPAGPDRDRAIALLLGWRADRTYLGKRAEELDRAADLAEPRWVSPDGQVHGSPPHYSTDPTACSALVFEVEARGLMLRRPAEGGAGTMTFALPTQPGRTVVIETEDPCDALSAAALMMLREAR